MNIGIIGRGFVGSSVEFGFSAQTGVTGFDLKIYDKDPSKSVNTLAETVNESDVIFLSVPTPSNEDGSINLSILEAAIADIYSVNERMDNIVLIRSTVVPGTTSRLQAQYPSLNLVFNPEFLTERSAKFDFINQARVVLGGDTRNTAVVAEMYKKRFGHTQCVIETTFETAELIKYMSNCYFAMKVSFLNEMKLISDAIGADWEDAKEGFVRDGRIGHSHMNVPGPDGRLGFGGSCFPKDIQAMIAFASTLGIESNTLKGAWATNLLVRPEQDWKELKGRAVI
jgi:nucleotide sugar dehydrogenase